MKTITMSPVTHFTSISFLLLLAIIDVNVSLPEHSGQHVTLSMASMANISDNKTWLEERKSDPISISISPTPTWSSTSSPPFHAPHSTNTITTTPTTTSTISPNKPEPNSSAALLLPPSPSPRFGSIVTKTPESPQKTSNTESHHHDHHQLLGWVSGGEESIHPANNSFFHRRKSFSSKEIITEVKRSADEFEFQLEVPAEADPPLSLASSSTRVIGPYFESNKTIFHYTARAGQTVMFDCTVVLLQGRTVSWLRKRKDNLLLLTVGNTTYYSDSRVSLRFRYPNNWRLGIDMVQKGDEAEYLCQLATHPPKALIFHLKVIAPAVQILDENGQVVVTERHYKVDSSLHLTCKASHVDKAVDNILWLKGDRPLPGGDNRIKVKLAKSQNGGGEATGYLSVLSVRKGDSGNYTCRVSTIASSTIAVHVLNGELVSSVQHENRSNSRSQLSPLVWVLGSLSLLISTLCPTALHMGSNHNFLS